MRGEMESRVTELNAQARYKEVIERGRKSGIINQGSFKIAGVGSTLLSEQFSGCQPHILYNIKTQSVLYIHIDPETIGCYESTIRDLRYDYEKTRVKYADKDEAAKKFFADGDIIHFQIIYTRDGVAVSNSKPHTNEETRVRKLLRCLNPINDTEHKEVPNCSRKIITRHIYVGQTDDTQLGNLAVNITSTGLELYALVFGAPGEPAPTDPGVLHAETKANKDSSYLSGSYYYSIIRQVNISSDGKNVSQVTNEDKLLPVPLSRHAQKEHTPTTIQEALRKLHTPENKQEWGNPIADAETGVRSITKDSSLSLSNQNLSQPLLQQSMHQTEEKLVTWEYEGDIRKKGSCTYKTTSPLLIKEISFSLLKGDYLKIEFSFSNVSDIAQLEEQLRKANIRLDRQTLKVVDTFDFSTGLGISDFLAAILAQDFHLFEILENICTSFKLSNVTPRSIYQGELTKQPVDKMISMATKVVQKGQFQLAKDLLDDYWCLIANPRKDRNAATLEQISQLAQAILAKNLTYPKAKTILEQIAAKQNPSSAPVREENRVVPQAGKFFMPPSVTNKGTAQPQQLQTAQVATLVPTRRGISPSDSSNTG